MQCNDRNGWTAQVKRGTGQRNGRAIPVIEERISAGKRTVETGRVKVRKSRHRHTETVDVPLAVDEFTVEHVPVDAPAGDSPPSARWEGETLIVPVLEERLSVEKRWWIREELHLTRHRREVHRPQEVELLSEEVHVERLPGSAGRPGRRNR